MMMQPDGPATTWTLSRVRMKVLTHCELARPDMLRPPGPDQAQPPDRPNPAFRVASPKPVTAAACPAAPLQQLALK